MSRIPPKEHSPDWAVLLGCAREAVGIESRPAFETEVLNWETVLRLADLHGLNRPLDQFLRAHPSVAPPSPVIARLQDRVRTRVQQNLHLTAALTRLVPVFEEAGIEVVAYKGPVLSQRLFGDPAFRDYDDLDLLVRRTDVEKASRVLKSRGYEPWFQLSSEQERRLDESQYARHFGNRATSVAVDLHWGFARPYFSPMLDEEIIWEDTDHLLLGGTSIRTIPDPLLLLLLCVHGSKHEPHPWNRLKWIVDVAALARSIPEERWPSLVEKARSLRMERSFLFGLLVARQLTGIELPSSVLERGARAGAPDLARTAVETVLGDGPSRMSRLEYDLRLMDGIWDRFRYLFHRALAPNPKDWSWVRLPPQMSPLYYLIRPVRLFGKMLRMRSDREGWRGGEE